MNPAVGAGGEIHVVGDGDDGAVLGVGEVFEDFLDHRAGGRVEIPGWFIGQNQDRVVGQGAAHRDTLALSAGKLPGEFMRVIAKP